MKNRAIVKNINKLHLCKKRDSFNTKSKIG
jgi:hypothetical protein